MIRVIVNGVRLYVDPDDILYATRPDEHGDVKARLQGGAVMLPCKTSLVKLVADYQQLILIHRMSVVSRKFIKAVVPLSRRSNGCTVILKNDTTLHGSRRFLEEWEASRI